MTNDQAGLANVVYDEAKRQVDIDRIIALYPHTDPTMGMSTRIDEAMEILEQIEARCQVDVE